MPELKRTLGLLECTLMGVGVILGAGIYALVGKAAALAGNAVWVSFLGAAVVAAFTGLSYAELSSFIPKAGGEYYYARRAFGEFVAFLVTWLLLVGLAIAAAAVALGFAGYFGAMFGTTYVWPAVALVAASALLLVYGIKQSAWVAGGCTVVELVGLVVVVAIGVPSLGRTDYLETAAAGTPGVLAAAALIFFAFIGFEEIVQLSEETKKPTRNIPLAVLLSVAICTGLYVLVAVCAVSVLGWQRLAESASPLADVVEARLGHGAFVALSAIALFSTANTVLVLVMSSSRLLYGMAEDGTMPAPLARIHRTRNSPYVATVLVAAAAATAIVTLENIDVVANLTNFALLATFLVINGAVIVLRFKEPGAPRPFRLPGRVGKVPLVPVAGMASSAVMLAHVGTASLLVGSSLIVAGTLVYGVSWWRRRQRGSAQAARS